MEIQALRHVPIHGVLTLVNHVDAMLALLKRRRYDLLSSGTVDDDIGSSDFSRSTLTAAAAGEEKHSPRPDNADATRAGPATPHTAIHSAPSAPQSAQLTPLASADVSIHGWPLSDAKPDSDSIVDVSAVDLSRLQHADGVAHSVDFPGDPAGGALAPVGEAALSVSHVGADASGVSAATAPSLRLPPIVSTPSKSSSGKASTWAGPGSKPAGATPLASARLAGTTPEPDDLAGAAALADARFLSPQPPVSGRRDGGATTPSLRSALHIVPTPPSGRPGSAAAAAGVNTPRSTASAFTKATTGMLSPSQKAAAAVDRVLARSVGMDAATAVEIEAVNAAHTHFRGGSSLAMRAFAHTNRTDLEDDADSDMEDLRPTSRSRSTSVQGDRSGALSRASSHGQIRAALASLERRSSISPSRRGESADKMDASFVAGTGGHGSALASPEVSFERDERSFRGAMDEIVRGFGRLVIRQVVDTRSSARAVLLLHTVFALPVAKRPRLAEVVSALQSHVLHQFDGDLDGILLGVDAMLRRGAAPSDFFRNWPPLASKVAFCRSCKDRIRVGMTLISTVGRGMTGPVVSQRAQAIMRQLDAVETKCVSAHIACLHAPSHTGHRHSRVHQLPALRTRWPT
jgi:hypothetical protein